MNIVDFRDLSWAILAPAALLLLVPLVWLIHLCVVRPRQGLLVCILVLPIYVTSESLLRALADVFGASQTLIPADVLFVLVLGGFLLSTRSVRLFREPGRYPIALGLLLFLIAALLSLGNSPEMLLSLMALLSYVQLFLLTLAVEAVPDNRQDLERMIRYWMYSYAVVLATGLIGLFSLWAGWDTFAVQSMAEIKATFRFPNQLSFFLAATLPVLFSLTFGGALPQRTRRLVLASLPVALVLVWFCGSRSGVVSVAVAGAAVGALHASRARVYLWAALCVLLLVASYGVSTQTSSQGVQDNSRRYTVFLDPDERSSEFSFFLDTNATAIAAFLRNPVIGGGVGAVLNRDIQEDQPLEAHNVFIGILGQTGLFGISASLLVVALATRNLLRARRLATSPFVKELAGGALAAFAGCFAHGLANFDWRARHLWFLLALTTVIRTAAEQEVQWERSPAFAPWRDASRPSRPAMPPLPLRSY